MQYEGASCLFRVMLPLTRTSSLTGDSAGRERPQSHPTAAPLRHATHGQARPVARSLSEQYHFAAQCRLIRWETGRESFAATRRACRPVPRCVRGCSCRHLPCTNPELHEGENEENPCHRVRESSPSPQARDADWMSTHRTQCRRGRAPRSGPRQASPRQNRRRRARPGVHRRVLLVPVTLRGPAVPAPPPPSPFFPVHGSVSDVAITPTMSCSRPTPCRAGRRGERRVIRYRVAQLFQSNGFRHQSSQPDDSSDSSVSSGHRGDSRRRCFRFSLWTEGDEG